MPNRLVLCLSLIYTPAIESRLIAWCKRALAATTPQHATHGWAHVTRDEAVIFIGHHYGVPPTWLDASDEHHLFIVRNAPLAVLAVKASKATVFAAADDLTAGEWTAMRHGVASLFPLLDVSSLSPGAQEKLFHDG